MLSNIRDKTTLVMEDVNSVFDGHFWKPYVYV